MRWTIPNILTTARLISAPALAIVYAVLPHPYSDMVALVLFVVAASTDWLDGYLARRWGQVSRYGAMLDPIADKAMVIIAVAALGGLFEMDPLVLLPAAVILFREVFVSGLREFLGDTAGTLAVTKLAKWKTAVQMTAVAVLLSNGIFEHYVGMGFFGMGHQMALEMLGADEAGGIGIAEPFWRAMGGLSQGWSDAVGFQLCWVLMQGTYWIGIALFWAAALLTGITGWDYFRKAQPHLGEVS
jgi:CDP-diacylglycerol--glycerol-3-phosphate 3-phosphatidyltransferase